MVRGRAIPWAVAMVVATLGGRAASAEDWTAAGGDLFVPPAAEAPGASAGPPRPAETPEPTFADDLAAAAARQGLDPKLLAALVAVESAGRPGAVSPAGAAGLTQLMPGTARDLQVEDVFDPAQNLAAGARFLARQIRRFGDLRLALAAYNAGPDLVARLGRVPAIPETQAYVEDVVACFLALTAGRRVASARDCRGAGAAGTRAAGAGPKEAAGRPSRREPSGDRPQPGGRRLAAMPAQASPVGSGGPPHRQVRSRPHDPEARRQDWATRTTTIERCAVRDAVGDEAGGPFR